MSKLIVAHMDEVLEYMKNHKLQISTADLSGGIGINYMSVYKALMALKHNGKIIRRDNKNWELKKRR